MAHGQTGRSGGPSLPYAGLEPGFRGGQAAEGIVAIDDDLAILEISSFQLDQMTVSPNVAAISYCAFIRSRAFVFPLWKSLNSSPVA